MCIVITFILRNNEKKIKAVSKGEKDRGQSFCAHPPPQKHKVRKCINNTTMVASTCYISQHTQRDTVKSIFAYNQKKTNKSWKMTHKTVSSEMSRSFRETNFSRQIKNENRRNTQIHYVQSEIRKSEIEYKIKSIVYVVIHVMAHLNMSQKMRPFYF